MSQSLISSAPSHYSLSQPGGCMSASLLRLCTQKLLLESGLKPICLMGEHCIPPAMPQCSPLPHTEACKAVPITGWYSWAFFIPGKQWNKNTLYFNFPWEETQTQLVELAVSLGPFDPKVCVLDHCLVFSGKRMDCLGWQWTNVWVW